MPQLGVRGGSKNDQGGECTRALPHPAPAGTYPGGEGTGVRRCSRGPARGYPRGPGRTRIGIPPFQVHLLVRKIVVTALNEQLLDLLGHLGLPLLPRSKSNDFVRARRSHAAWAVGDSIWYRSHAEGPARAKQGGLGGAPGEHGGPWPSRSHTAGGVLARPRRAHRGGPARSSGHPVRSGEQVPPIFEGKIPGRIHAQRGKGPANRDPEHLARRRHQPWPLLPAT